MMHLGIPADVLSARLCNDFIEIVMCTREDTATAQTFANLLRKAF